MKPKTFDDLSSAMQASFNRMLKSSAVMPVANAIEMLREMVKRDPEFLPARERLRELEKEYTAKLSAGQIIFQNIFSFFSLGLRKIIYGSKPVKFMSSCEDIFAKNLNNVFALKSYAAAAAKAEALFLAVDALLIARFYSPKDKSVLMLLGDYLSLDRHSAEAAKFYQELSTIVPNNQQYKSLVRKALAAASLEAEAEKQAIEEAENPAPKNGGKALQTRDSEEAVVQQLLDGTIHDADQANLVIGKLKGILEERESLDIRRKIAEAYQVAGDYDSAIINLEKVAEALGAMDAKLDKWIEKLYILKFNGLIKELTAHPDAYENSANQLANLKIEREQFRLQRALNRSTYYPNDLQLHYELGLLYYQHGRFADAITQFESSEKNLQRRGDSHFYMGKANFKLEKYEDAVNEFNKALESLSAGAANYKDALYYLGSAYEKCQNPEAAKENYMKLHKIDPAFKDVLQKIA